jgi:hypothetical protein
LPFSLALVYLILALGVGWRQISLGKLPVKLPVKSPVKSPAKSRH